MRTKHLSYRQQARGPSRSHSRLRVSRLTAMIALFLVAVAMLVQVGSTGVQRANAATCTVSCNVDDSGNWRTPANWAPPAVSGPTGDVCIDRTAADVSVTIDIPAVVDSLTSTGNFAPPSSDSLELTAPANDDFANATGLGSDAGSLIGETNVDASAEVGEPSHDGLTFTPARSVWYQWTPAASAIAVVEVAVPFPGNWDPVLAAYTGSSLDALTEVAATHTTGYRATIKFRVEAGTTYHLAVDGYDSTESGTFDLIWSIPAPNDDFANAKLMTGEVGSLIGERNEEATAEAGEPNHNGVTPSRSVWYRWTPAVDGNAVVGATTHPYATWNIVMGVYIGTAVDALTEVTAGGGPTSVALEVEFRVEAGTTYYLAIDGRTSLETGSFDLTWSIPSPPNDDFSEATTLVGDSGWLLAETNELATAEPGEPAHNGLAGTPARSVWYEWTASADGTAVVKGSTRPYSDNTIVMAAYTGAAVDALTEMASWGGPGVTRIRLEFGVVAGTTYHIVLDGTDESETGSFDLTWALSPPANDDFADATVLAGRSGTLQGETTEGATPEVGELAHAGVAGTPARSVWYEWTPTWDGSATIDIDTPSAPDDWDSVVALYTGSTLGSLTQVAADSTFGDSLHLEFDVVGGTTYRLVVDGHDSDNWGSFDLTWANDPVSGTFIVTKTEDTDDGACDADCSLREAVVAANATGGDDTIHLPAGVYQLTLDWSGAADHFGSLDIEREAGTTSILGEGRDITVIDATTLRTLGVSNPDRVFKVGYHAGLELVGVTVTGGYTERSSQQDGGGIWNWNGYLIVTDCLIEGNVAGENGGGIANAYGTATITNSIIRDNNTDPPDNPMTGHGGGIYNSGTITVVDSMIELNASDWGGGLASQLWLTDYEPSVTINNSTITSNTAIHGAGVANIETMPGTEQAVLTVNNSQIIDNHADRSSSTYNEGGGILNLGYYALATIRDSTISGNIVTGFRATNPKDGSGGGIHNRAGVVEVIATTITDNHAIFDQPTGDNFQGGRGGGVLNTDVGRVTIINSTISGNSATLLNRTAGDWNGGGVGGAVSHARYCDPVCKDPTTTIINTTITGNEADTGGGIDNTYEDVKLTVTNSIVSGNSGDLPGYVDCWGEYVSTGHNLVGDGTGCPADGPGDVTTADPLLGPLTDNGGATLTHSLLATSPAIDAGDTSLTVDQRGVTRPQGSADDIGAFEAIHTSNTPPVLDAIGDWSVAEGATLDVGITASDADGDPLTFTLSGEPVFAALVDHGDGTATLSLTPGFDDAGVYPGVTVTVSDSVDTDSETFTITVTVEETIHLFLPLVLRSH